MDDIIAGYNYVIDADLNICHEMGVAYQSDMSKSVDYDVEYFNKYLSYEDTEIGKQINDFRVDLVKQWCSSFMVLDVGIGSGTFLKGMEENNIDYLGYDINPEAVTWLNSKDKFYNINSTFQAITFWDSIEHIPNPQEIINQIQVGTYTFVSIPVFEDLDNIRESKHYRPDEHYYYFTTNGFLKWFKQYSFKLLKIFDDESRIGRDSIKTFLFERVVPSSEVMKCNLRMFG